MLNEAFSCRNIFFVLALKSIFSSFSVLAFFTFGYSIDTFKFKRICLSFGLGSKYLSSILFKELFCNLYHFSFLKSFVILVYSEKLQNIFDFFNMEGGYMSFSFNLIAFSFNFYFLNIVDSFDKRIIEIYNFFNLNYMHIYTYLFKALLFFSYFFFIYLSLFCL